MKSIMKILSLFAIVLMVLSTMTVALAKSTDNVTATEQVQTTATSAELGDSSPLGTVNGRQQGPLVRPTEPLPKAGPRPVVAPKNQDLNRTQLKEQVRERLENAKERAGQVRERVQEHLQQARERFEQAKERYQAAREKYQKTKQTIAAAREKFASCQEDNNTECEQARRQVHKNGKPFLLNSADMILTALDRASTQISDSTDLTEEQKTELLADIDARVADVTEAKATIENLDNSSTSEEIRAAAKTIRNAWRETRKTLVQSAGHLINARLGNIIVQTERLSLRIHNARDRLAAQGNDVTALDDAMAGFDAKLADAKTEWQAAVDLYANVRPGEMDQVAQEAHEHVKQAQEYLKEVRDDLRDIVTEIKGETGSLDIVNEDANATVEVNATTTTDANASA